MDSSIDSTARLPSSSAVPFSSDMRPQGAAPPPPALSEPMPPPITPSRESVANSLRTSKSPGNLREFGNWIKENKVLFAGIALASVGAIIATGCIASGIGAPGAIIGITLIGVGAILMVKSSEWDPQKSRKSSAAPTEGDVPRSNDAATTPSRGPLVPDRDHLEARHRPSTDSILDSHDSTSSVLTSRTSSSRLSSRDAAYDDYDDDDYETDTSSISALVSDGSEEERGREISDFEERDRDVRDRRGIGNGLAGMLEAFRIRVSDFFQNEVNNGKQRIK